MRGLMMDTPLMISSLLKYAAAYHSEREIVSRMTDGSVHRPQRRVIASGALLEIAYPGPDPRTQDAVLCRPIQFPGRRPARRLALLVARTLYVEMAQSVHRLCDLLPDSPLDRPVPGRAGIVDVSPNLLDGSQLARALQFFSPPLQGRHIVGGVPVTHSGRVPVVDNSLVGVRQGQLFGGVLAQQLVDLVTPGRRAPQ